jgi:hypothetical protein
MLSSEATQPKALTDATILPVSRSGSRFGYVAQRLILLIGLAVVCTGCSLTQGVKNYLAYNDNSNDFVMGWRNSVWSSQAWHNQKHYFVGHPEIRAFGAGFRDGYQAVAAGSNGCPPPLPPRKYWTWKYQTAEGQAKVAAWFEGYSHGATAAEEDGADNFQDIQVSYLIETQHSPEFQAGTIPEFNPGEYIVPGSISVPVEPSGVTPIGPLPNGAPQFAPPMPAAPPAPADAPHVSPVSWNRLPPPSNLPPQSGYPNGAYPR